MSELPGLSPEERWIARTREIATRASTIGGLLHEVAQEATLIQKLDPEGLQDELAILGDAANFGMTAASRILELMSSRAAARAEEMRG